MNLNIDKWKIFRLGDLIDEIYKSKAYNKTDLQTFDYYDKNLIPYVSRTESNNSVDCFVEKSNFDKIESGNAIVIGDTTSTVSYQKNCFVTGDHIVVIRAKWLNEFTGLFIATLLQMEKYRYSYGRAYVVNSIVNTMIKLPVDDNDNPNWNWIQKFIKSLHYQLPNTQINSNPIRLNFNNWKYFKIEDLFDVTGSSTTPLTKLEEIGNGNYPYVTTQAKNNGIAGYYDYFTEQGNVLTIDSAVQGYCAYQEKCFSASDHVELLIPKFKMNKYIGLFFVTIINKENFRYNYGIKFNQGKIKQTKIKLPTTPDGKVDYNYIEKFIKSLPYADKI